MYCLSRVGSVRSCRRLGIYLYLACIGHGLNHGLVITFAAHAPTQSSRGYYLIIDRLFEILDQRIRKWHGPKRRREGSSSRTGKLFASFAGGKQFGGGGNMDKGGVDGKASLDEKLDVGKP